MHLKGVKMLPGKRDLTGQGGELIPKVINNDAFHRGDFGRQQGARCAVVRVQQAVRNAPGAPIRSHEMSHY